MLTEADQEVVVFDPVSLRQFGPQGELGFLGIFGPHVPPTVGYPMHVGIHADPRLTVAQGHDQVGGLSPHPLELQEFIDIVRDLAGIFIDQGPAYLSNGLCLNAVETDRKDCLFNLLRRETQHLPWRVCQFKKTMTGLGRGRILSTQAQDTGNQDMKRTVPGLRYQRDDRHLPFGYLSSQYADCLVDFPFFHLTGFLSLD